MAKVQKARLVELKEDLSDVLPGGKDVEVQFNPETLKVSFANQVQTPANGAGQGGGGGSGGGAGDQSRGSTARQFVGAGTTKLSLQLWFDVSAASDDRFRLDDVRRLTQEVVYFMTPQESKTTRNQLVPPGIRFHWGSFIFDGIVDSLEESLEFFSPEGKPLRASITLNLSQQKILKVEFQGDGRRPGQPATPGTRPLAQAKSGSSVQSLADGQGGSLSWQSIAAANGIENPRLLAAGQLVDLRAGGQASAGVSLGGSAGLGSNGN